MSDTRSDTVMEVPSRSQAYGRFPSLYKTLPAEKAQILETYAYHARLGYFNLTESTWIEVLSHQEVDFVTLIARVDCLLRQTRYKEASAFIQGALQRSLEASSTSFSHIQTKLLQLHQAWTNIHTKGALRYAIAQANDVHNWLPSNAEPADEDVKVSIATSSLHILRLTMKCSDLQSKYGSTS